MADDKTSNIHTLPHSHHAEDQIRKRAYELYESRGCEDGHAMDDWLRAEQEVRSKETRKVAA